MSKLYLEKDQEDDDGLNAARGFFWGLVIGSMFWLGIIYAIGKVLVK